MTKREDKKRDKRIEIIANAVTLFKQKGYDNVTTAEIAKQSHIAKKTLFQYFPTKDAIVFNDDQELLDIIIKYLQTRPTDLWAGYQQLIETLADQDDDTTNITADMFKLPQIIAESPALFSRLQVMWATYEQEIANCLLAESLVRSAISARVWAAQLVLVFRISFDTNEPIDQIFSELNIVLSGLH